MFIRKLNRLRSYDYSQSGMYFVTICTQNRKHLFGCIKNGVMYLNLNGNIAYKYFNEIPKHHNNINIDQFVIMPNHVHGIITVGTRHAVSSVNNTNDFNGTRHAVPLRKFGVPMSNSLSSIIGSYKSAVTKHINKSSTRFNGSIWQRNYYDHIIRDDTDLNRIRMYIQNNPINWHKDALN